MNCLGLIAFTLALVAPAPGEAVIRGRLVWPATAAIPKNPPAEIDKRHKECLPKGPILKDELIVHPKNRGIKNAVFFLIDAKEALRPLPLTGSAKRLPKAVEIKAIACRVEPRVAVVAPGQRLILNNGKGAQHSLHVDGLFPPFGRLVPVPDREGLGKPKPSLFPGCCCCSIHAWMRGYVFAPPSPYAAVTDADGNFAIRDVPKGAYRLVGWHEKFGYIFPPVKGASGGRPIVIKAGVNNIGELARGGPG